MNKERAEKLRPLLVMKPGLITNNRLGGGFKGDSDTPEQHIPATGIKDRDWEVCMTMNETWGYKSYDDNWKSTTDLLHKLIDISSKGGNFLLNVGPKPDGTIPQESIDRLAGVGEWMDKYSEAVYETQPSPFRRPWWGRCTRKTLDKGDTRLYLSVFDWPEDGILTVPVVNDAIQSFSLADNSQKYEVRKTQKGLNIGLRGNAQDAIASVIVLDIKGAPEVTNQIIVSDENGMLTLRLDESDLENRSYVTTDHARLIRSSELNHITWKSTRTWMEWPVGIKEEGIYDVYVNLASNTSGNKLAIETGEERVEYDLMNTGGLDKFQRGKIGSIEISDQVKSIVVKGFSDKWEEIYFGDIVLVPATK